MADKEQIKNCKSCRCFEGEDYFGKCSNGKELTKISETERGVRIVDSCNDWEAKRKGKKDAFNQGVGAKRLEERTPQ